jgi:hypothetical protein
MLTCDWYRLQNMGSVLPILGFSATGRPVGWLVCCQLDLSLWLNSVWILLCYPAVLMHDIQLCCSAAGAYAFEAHRNWCKNHSEVIPVIAAEAGT